MNTTHGNETGRNAAGRDDTAVGRAEAGTGGWEDAVRLQRWATADHADFYALAGEIVSTLHALDDLTGVLRRQVEDYAQTQTRRGQLVYDDTYGAVDPRARLISAAGELQLFGSRLGDALRPANRFWSAIGHIGTDPRGTKTGGSEAGGENGEVTP